MTGIRDSGFSKEVKISGTLYVVPEEKDPASAIEVPHTGKPVKFRSKF